MGKKRKKGKKDRKKGRGKKAEVRPLTREELEEAGRGDEILREVDREGLDVGKVRRRLGYLRDLRALQVEMIRLQTDVIRKGRRVALVFEGRDAAGKGGTIRRFREHLIPRQAPVVALPKPTEKERGEWYFQRYVAQLPAAGELRFFDRSWYNRAVVEPVMGFCDQAQYRAFMGEVERFEDMLLDDGLELVKFWLEISKDEQAERFAARRASPLKRWKIGPVDEKAQGLWDEFTRYSQAMLAETGRAAPWVVVQADSKKKARLACMRHVLSTLDYEGKGETGIDLEPDAELVEVRRDEG